MKAQNQVRITNENTRITEQNVQHLGECIALSAIKKMMRFAHHPRSLDKLYASLVEDIYSATNSNVAIAVSPSAQKRVHPRQELKSATISVTAARITTDAKSP